MLSLFPDLLTYGQVAPFLLRITLGAVLLFWSYKTCKGSKSRQTTAFAVLHFIIGFLLVIGLYTQLAALVASIILLVHLIKKIKMRAFFTDGINYYFLLLAISLSILFLGSGIFSFDLPL